MEYHGGMAIGADRVQDLTPESRATRDRVVAAAAELITNRGRGDYPWRRCRRCSRRRE
jgi:hypothetical protein